MDYSTLNIFIRPGERIEEYPDTLGGDMSIFKEFRYEVQWIFYLLLRDHFNGLTLIRSYPDSGILLIHKGNTEGFVWKPDLFVVSAQWDYPRDDRAQAHLVSNMHKTTNASLGLLDRLSGAGLQYCIPPIMHPIVKPRNESRGDLFENVVFMGAIKNLDEAFHSNEFKQRVADLGMKFSIMDDPHKHSDYSEIDVVMAVRKLGKVINNKPAVKLYNSWRGKVPAILGCEIGFREVRESEYDYIEVDSVDDVIAALTKLKNDLEFRKKIIANAEERSKSFSAEGQQACWIEFFVHTLIPAYEEWLDSSYFSRRWFLCRRWIRSQLRIVGSHLIHRVLKVDKSHFH